jgi:glycosyltransferase involved in cell wall biosynthesis
MNAGRILVVLPTLGDRLATLEETLLSVDQQRAQVDLTLVVVLPASAHKAREMATHYGARVIDDPRRGISHAINLGIESATNETYYAWIGDDDLFRPAGLATLRSLIAASPTAVLAYGGCDYIDPVGRLLFTSRAGWLAKWLLPWGPDLIPHPGSLLRLDAMRAVGLFDTNLKYAMDLDLFLKIRAHGTFVSTGRSVSAFRWHPDSLTVSNRRASTAEAEMIKRKHLPRWLRPASPMWNAPTRLASAQAASSVSRRARRLEVRPR